MELSWLLVFKIGASLAGVIVGIGMFSELSWPVKLKITTTLLLGIILIGLLGWPLVVPIEPFGVVSVPALHGAVTLLGLAVLVGFIGYFISKPLGREIGILAVPVGLAIWAVRCGNMAELMRLNSTLPQRQTLFAVLKWEPIFWLAIVAAGFGGVLVGQYLVPALQERGESRPSSLVPSSHQASSVKNLVSGIIATVVSVFIVQFCIGIFAQDIRIADPKLGSVVVQPATGQIVFAVMVSFGIAGFLVKKFLNAGYIWPMMASALVTGFTVITHLKQEILQQLVEHHPPAFFSSTNLSILPVQIVSFGVLGSIAGFWLAVRYSYLQKNTSSSGRPHYSPDKKAN
jgi:hypothetical protein